MTRIPVIAHMVREGKTHQLSTAMQTGRKEGMQIMAQHMNQFIEDGVITPDAAIATGIEDIAMINTAPQSVTEPVA